MSYTRAPLSLGACCSGCAGGMGDVRPIDTAVKPGESVYDYMARISAEIGTEIKVAEAGRTFAAARAAADKAVADAAAKAPAGETAVRVGMSSTTKLLLLGGAGVALFMLTRRR